MCQVTSLFGVMIDVVSIDVTCNGLHMDASQNESMYV